MATIQILQPDRGQRRTRPYSRRMSPEERQIWILEVCIEKTPWRFILRQGSGHSPIMHYVFSFCHTGDLQEILEGPHATFYKTTPRGYRTLEEMKARLKKDPSQLGLDEFAQQQNFSTWID